MMTTDSFTHQLSPYLDGELDAGAAAALEAHVATCAGCRATLEDLRAIVSAAPHYPGRAPSLEVWRGIEARLDEGRVVPLRAPGLRFSWRELLAASLAMAVVGGGAGWVLSHRGTPSVGAVVAVGPSASTLSVPVDLRNAAAEARYDAAVHDLEQVLEAGRGWLDSATVRTVRESLDKIDRAVAEARAAIQRDPANEYLSRQIAANLRRKLNLLRTATNAIAARS